MKIAKWDECALEIFEFLSEGSDFDEMMQWIWDIIWFWRWKNLTNSLKMAKINFSGTSWTGEKFLIEI